MICPFCNSEIKNGVKFCPKCGNELSDYLYAPPPSPAQPYTPYPPYNQPPIQQVIYQQPVKEETPGKGAGIASMVLGIVGFLSSYGSVILGFVGLICGIVGCVKAKSKGRTNGFAIAGIVVSVIDFIWFVALIFLIGGVVGLFGMGALAESL